MAYRRNITARAKLFYKQKQRVAPSFSHIYTDDRSDLKELQPASRISNFLPHHFFATNLLRDRRFAFPTCCGPVFTRNFSGGSFGEAAAADKIDIFTNVLVDKTVEVAPVDKIDIFTGVLV